ncbi:hypothetical protein VM1G_07472 [Cytospora mali]|uniref:Protein kinase domain-containing protein n=1 Tax=Cytospora mali TaxID=578113 RepID=A0A194W6F1_CYTMA|nr:hypothetical protein VM1G_07472 [Valsa mali]
MQSLSQAPGITGKERVVCQRNAAGDMVTPDEVDKMSIDAVPFCTSLCVQSMLHSTGTDLSCPNQAAHQQRPRLQTLARGAITLPQFLPNPDNTEEDPPVLIRNPTANAIYTGQYGATSAIFKVRIEPGGYVLVAKAARSTGMVRRLRREERISHSFQRAYPRVLLSWAGSPLLDCSSYGNDVDVNGKRLRADADAALRQVHWLGVLHQDAEVRNWLINDSGVTLVDFERAITRSGFSRRAPRTDDDDDDAFRYACDREMELCLAHLDRWSKHLKGSS